MKWNTVAPLALCVLALPVALTGCDDSRKTDEEAPLITDVTVAFEAAVNDQAFVCGTTYSGVGTATADTYQVNDFRFYIHDLVLTDALGNEYPVALTQDGTWQYQNLALLDFEDGCSTGTPITNTQVVGTAEAGVNYTGVCFTVGVPFGLNHLDADSAEPPLDTNIGSGMIWSWTTGRKFVRIDGKGDPANLNVGYNIHLGSTGCSDTGGDPAPDAECAYPNTLRVCLDNFDVRTQHIVVDAGAVLSDSDVTVNTVNTAAGCMSANSDPECQEILPAMGLDFVYMDGVNAPQTYPKDDPQRFFYVH